MSSYQINKHQMKNENQHSDPLTVADHPLMTEKFLKVYENVLSFSKCSEHLRYRNVRIYEKDYIHQVYTVDKGNENKPHLVCLHGFGSTCLAYLHMFQYLYPHFQVHALDTYGMGLSSRGNWDDDMTPKQVISYYVGAVEQWCKSVGIKRFILVGHSFGGYIASHYMVKYADKVSQLIFLSPAGMDVWSEEEIEQKKNEGRSYFGWSGRLGFNMHLRPTKMATIPCCGGSMTAKMLREKLKMEDEDEVQAWKQYILRTSRQDKVSESGFYTLIRWPDSPNDKGIVQILTDLKLTIPIAFFNGDTDWMSLKGSKKLAKSFKNVSLHIIEKAGHYLTTDNPKATSQVIIEITRHLKQQRVQLQI